jgi:16S rRNA (guanine966-N2)-methyltransferase
MRVTGGKWRGRALVTPADRQTRPTTDKARIALFNSLLSLIGSFEDRAVLDCFAGSGALSFEALSRGASHAVLVDVHNAAIRAIRSNIDSFECRDQATAIKGNILKLNLRNLDKTGFDLVFIDPPYRFESQEVYELLGNLEAQDKLCKDTIIVYEHGSDQRIDTPPGFAQIKEKEYGSTHITYLRYKGAT